jgi:hypothetical protein
VRLIPTPGRQACVIQQRLLSSGQGDWGVPCGIFVNTGNGHESVPFTGPNAIAGRAFPDTDGNNQPMGATVSP